MAKKSKKPTPEYDSQRETRVLLEEIRDQVKVVAEQHGSVMNKLEEHDSKFERMEQRFDRLEMATMTNSRDIKDLKSGQERIEEKLDTTIENHEKRLKKVEAKVSL